MPAVLRIKDCEKQYASKLKFKKKPIVNLGPVKTTPVYEAYWSFAAERQAIYFRRLRGQPAPWTEDSILASFRFTNPYRAADRVSQYLIQK